MYRFGIYMICLCLLSGCGGGKRTGNNTRGETAADDNTVTIVIPVVDSVVPAGPEDAGASPEEWLLSGTAAKLDSMGLVDITEYDPRIAVEMVYATADNFVGEVLYDDLDRAYFLPEVAEKLSRAQTLLEEERPGYRLIVYDAARPMSVQRKMRKVAEKTGKHIYVADPARGGGLHNYGAAVDVSVLDAGGDPLDMGTGYDFLGPESNIDREPELVRDGKISRKQLENRLLLRGIMRKAGFTAVTSEWWHFNHVSRKYAIENYELIDF